MPCTFAGMRLSEYLTAAQTTPTAFARKLGVAHSTVLRWAAGDVAPSLDWMERIATATGGEVMPNDFMRDGDVGAGEAPHATHEIAGANQQ